MIHLCRLTAPCLAPARSVCPKPTLECSLSGFRARGLEYRADILPAARASHPHQPSSPSSHPTSAGPSYCLPGRGALLAHFLPSPRKKPCSPERGSLLRHPSWPPGAGPRGPRPGPCLWMFAAVSGEVSLVSGQQHPQLGPDGFSEHLGLLFSSVQFSRSVVSDSL